ncbi:hypothetical protein Pf1_02136 [Flavobacterium columnare]|nr:hypothetical protein Pf1_02136 [Flavobacterium columnare]
MNPKKYSLFSPQCKTIAVVKNFRPFLPPLPFSSSLQSLTDNLD